MRPGFRLVKRREKYWGDVARGWNGDACRIREGEES